MLAGWPCALACACAVKAMCTEAGLLALRERRMKVSHAEFKKAREYVMYKKKGGAPEGLYL